MLASDNEQDIVEWDSSQKSRVVKLYPYLVGFFFTTTVILAVATGYLAISRPASDDNDQISSAECQTSFKEATTATLKTLHTQVRTDLWTNPAFNDESQRQRSEKTARGMLQEREVAERDFWHEKKGKSTPSWSSLPSSDTRRPREENATLSRGGIYLEGTETTLRGYSDTEVGFTQESNFLYLSGVNRPDCLFLLDIATQTSFLFVPYYDDFYATWVGEVPSLGELKEFYGVTDALYIDDLPTALEVLSQSNPENYPIYTLPGLETDTIPSNYSIEDESLLPILWEQRDVKNEFEIQLLKTAASVSAQAHVDNMKKIKSGLFEYSLSSNFLAYIGYCSFTHIAYETIAGAGANSAILHYTAAVAEILSDQLFLIDAGGQYRGYTTDITRTYPSGGKYSSDQNVLYNMVYAVQTQCIESLEPGVNFTDTMELASKLICEQLIENDFVLSDVEECLKERLFSLFMPHGLGHFVGLDVHDTSLYPTTLLQAGNVLTIEPGIYFNEVLLFPAIQVGDPRSESLNSEKISSYLSMQIGGVRIEDVVLIVEGGYDVISDSAPTLLADIEELMA